MIRLKEDNTLWCGCDNKKCKEELPLDKTTFTDDSVSDAKIEKVLFDNGWDANENSRVFCPPCNTTRKIMMYIQASFLNDCGKEAIDILFDKNDSFYVSNMEEVLASKSIDELRDDVRAELGIKD